MIILLQNLYYINKGYFKRDSVRQENRTLLPEYQTFNDPVNIRQLQGRMNDSHTWGSSTHNDVTTQRSDGGNGVNVAGGVTVKKLTSTYPHHQLEGAGYKRTSSLLSQPISTTVQYSTTHQPDVHLQNSSVLYFQKTLSNDTYPYHKRFALPTEQRIRSIFSYESVKFDTYQLNAGASQNRTLIFDVPDVRPSACSSQQYLLPPYKEKVSVIIPFHNELWINIVRLIYSIIYRTPADLLQEIILLDDASEEENLQKPLEKFITIVPKVRLRRLPQREGLIRARVFGAQMAKGDVLVFLDAHVICNQDWVQPLIAAIKQDTGTVAIPMVDTIEPYTLQVT